MYSALVVARNEGHTLRYYELESTFSGANASPRGITGRDGIWLHGFAKSEELVEAILGTISLMDTHRLELGAIVCTGIKSYDALGAAGGLPEYLFDHLVFEARR